jgi:hypothetical protein
MFVFVCGLYPHSAHPRAISGTRSSFSVRSKGTDMQLLEIFEEGSRKRLLQGAFVGFLATVVIGFNWGGWTLGSTARQMAYKSANVLVAAAPDARAWTQILARYRAPSAARSSIELAITIVPLGLVWALMWASASATGFACCFRRRPRDCWSGYS